MRTTITIDDALVRPLLALTGQESLAIAARTALRRFVCQAQIRKIAEEYPVSDEMFIASLEEYERRQDDDPSQE